MHRGPCTAFAAPAPTASAAKVARAAAPTRGAAAALWCAQGWVLHWCTIVDTSSSISKMFHSSTPGRANSCTNSCSCSSSVVRFCAQGPARGGGRGAGLGRPGGPGAAEDGVTDAGGRGAPQVRSRMPVAVSQTCASVDALGDLVVCAAPVLERCDNLSWLPAPQAAPHAGSGCRHQVCRPC